MKKYIVYGLNYEDEARELGSLVNAEVLNVKHKIFPDGERYLRIEHAEKLSNSVAIVVNTMFPNQNDSLVETLMLINAARKANASKVIAVIPYLAYARQDKVFLSGEPVSAELVVKSLRMSGADVLITVDVHSPAILEHFDGIAVNLLVSRELVEKALEYLENPVVIAPDKGALERARYAAENLGLEYDYLVKHRDRETGIVKIEPKEASVSGRDVVIVDDIISTGGTIAEASKLLLSIGARKIVVAATHGLLVGSALDKLRKAGVYRVLLANTVGVKYEDPLVEYVDILRVIADKLGSIIEKQEK
ncbi:MAG: ribose-phosphate diphosphokinase [Thermoprotei archaeon]